MRWGRIVVAWTCGLTFLVLGTGCRTYRDQSATMHASWLSGHYEEAAQKYNARASRAKDSKDAVVWELEAGATLRAIGRFEESNVRFDEASGRMDEFDRKARVRLTSEAAAVMTNPQNLPYEGRASDKILLHTYKALNYLALGEADKARPELIRAYQRQQDAVMENARQIERAREEAASAENSAQVERSLHNPELAESLREITNHLDGFRVYADYVNPFTVYLDGLYFLHAGEGASDRERADMSMRRVAEMAGSNPYVQADLAALAAPTSGAGPSPGHPLTYVIFETGIAPSRKQVRIDIPILIADVSYVGAAFPELEFHGDYLDHLSITADGQSWNTQIIASMDSVLALEFRNEWPAIVTKAVLSAVAKATASYAVNAAARQQSDWGGLLARIATAAYQAAVNIADTRSWTTLPKQFQVARLPTPPDRKLLLTTSAGHREEVSLVEGRVNMVYVQSVSPTVPLLISQFPIR